jgi:hypothetical protein
MDRHRKSMDNAERPKNGLLLAEEFARIDVSRPRQFRSWVLARGALNRLEFYAGSAGAISPTPKRPSSGWEAQDEAAGVRFEQDYVRRTLDWLAELSERRDGGPKPWNLKNDTWEGALEEIGQSLRWRAERALRSVGRLISVTNEGGEEEVYTLVGLGKRLYWRERREWRTALAPISLQLFEAWRRISEGLQGAAHCRECGQVFLILDGRRTAFCTNRERNRYDQRVRRERMAPTLPGLQR